MLGMDETSHGLQSWTSWNMPEIISARLRQELALICSSDESVDRMRNNQSGQDDVRM